MPTPLRAHLALLTVALIYGGNYIIAKDVMNGGYLLPIGFIVLRAAAAVLLFWTFHAFFIKEKVNRRADFIRLFWCGFFGVAINQTFFFSGLERTSPINASLIMTTTPILVLVISAILLNEAITTRKIIGILLGAAGAITLIAYGKAVTIASNQLVGDLLVFTNALSFGVYLVISKPLMKRYHPFTVIKWTFTFGFSMVLPVGLPELQQAEPASWPAAVYFSVAYVLIGTTFLAYLLNAFALKLVNPSVVSIYIYLQPLFATTFALLLAKDLLTPIKVVAGLLIFLGVFLVSVPRLKRRTPARTST